MIPDWFQTAIDHPNRGRGLDILYDKIYDWYDEKNYAAVNAFLSELEEGDLTDVPVVLLLGLLTTTNAASHLLPARSTIYVWVRNVLLKRKPDLVDATFERLAGPSPGATEAHNQIFSGLLGGPAIPTEEP